MARPKAKIDWNEVGEMLKCGCPATSIATSLGISTDTLYTRSRTDNKLDFSAFSQQKRAAGSYQLRRKQYEIAMSGNVPMLIWLGKNRLGQSEKQEITQTSALSAAKDALVAAARFFSSLDGKDMTLEQIVLLASAGPVRELPEEQIEQVLDDACFELGIVEQVEAKGE